MNPDKSRDRKTYCAPELAKKGNIRTITFECQSWQCSVIVPPQPQQ